MPTHPEPTDRAEVQKLANAVEAALLEHMQTRHRDDSPLPAVGTTPPVPQPGRPPMSQKAVDSSVLMLSAGVASLPIGGMTSLVLYTLGTVDPVTLGIAACSPAVVLLALARLVRSAGKALPSEHHHHYGGTVNQHTQNVTSHSRLWGKTTNNL